jgi:protein-S-isoprenylcysteine O-methyltransferase Ste14
MGNLFNVVGQCVNIWSLLAVIIVCTTVVICKVIFSKREERLLDFANKYTNIHMVIIEDNTQIEIDLK